METLNLRKKKRENEQIIIDLWNRRAELKNEREYNTLNIKAHNDKIAECIREILRPVANKTKMPIIVEITEGATFVHIDFKYYANKTAIRSKVTFDLENINQLLKTKETLVSSINKIESYIRLLKKAVGITHSSSFGMDNKHKLIADDPGVVKVFFSTRTRYF